MKNPEEKLEMVSVFIEEKKSMYQQELRESSTDVERFVWTELVALLDQISNIIEEEG